MIRQTAGQNADFHAEFDLSKCKLELTELKDKLNSDDNHNDFRSESKEILPFFYQRTNLCLAIGISHPSLGWVNLLKTEYDLGNFRCDLVLGNLEEKRFLLIEFEDAEENSIFKKLKTRRASEWATRLEHGLSQIIDWIYNLSDMKQTDDYKSRFGENPQLSYLLIIGRSRFLDESEKKRLLWRVEHTVVDSQKILILTFDELAEKIEIFIKRFEKYR